MRTIGIVENREFIRLLAETADLMEIAGEDSYRIRSYRNAVAAIESFPERLEDVLRDPNRSVTEIPGIGKGLAAVLDEICRRGSFERRDELLERYPPTALELLKIQGLGPKTISLLWEHFRVSTVDGLEQLARDHKLRTMPRMGAKMEEKVLRGIEQYRKGAGRFLLSFGYRTAREVTEPLQQLPGLTHVEPAGSLRRGRETIGDLDVLVTGDNAARALDVFLKHPKVDEVLGHGPDKASARFGLEGIQVDVRALPDESYGAGLLYFTGNKQHSLALRNRALDRGLSLNEYGLTRAGTGERVAGATEEEVYEALGLRYIPPELREGTGEIEAAEQDKLPKLVELSDIRGDLHMHTTESDGRASLEEMAEAARERGYEYIAITDHSKALRMANGLDEARVVAFARQVREVNQRGLGIHVFAGLECDIKRDGSMDIAWDALAELDVVIGSVHSYMNMERDEMTARLLKALECPHLTYLAHPTGRVLLHREGYVYDFDRIAAEAARRGVAMEINASPERLDLDATHLRAAKRHGVKFMIDTDAHHPRHLGFMRYGITMARRGWLERQDILNTLPLDQFRQAIHKTTS